MNGYMGQLKGPFKADEELFDKIVKNSVEEIAAVGHLGVQAEVSTFIIINGEEIEIGKTGMYEVRDTEITSVKFKTDVDENTLVDYVITFKEEDE
jgi:hypothetical protein